jgi:uncharacterized protein (TIGR02118 family)
MVKLVFCLHRSVGMDEAEFHRYWRDVHAPLVQAHAAALGISRYVQVHTVHPALNVALGATRQAPPAFDGVAELWFEDLDVLASRAATPEGAEAAEMLLTDERRFIDHSRSPLFVCAEHAVI